MLLSPDAGQVEIAGIDVVADPTAARARIGLAGPFAAVDGFLTGRVNMTMIARLYGLSGRVARRRADELLERIGLTAAAGRRVETYSGGMRRRLDLAATLVGGPQIIFLDEPTTGVDPRSRLDLWDLVGELVHEGTTVLLTTQYLEEADRRGDRVSVIDDGRIVADGTSADLKHRLGGAVLDLSIEADDGPTALEVLEWVTGERAAAVPDTNRVRAPARDGTRTLLLAVGALDAAGVATADVALHEPTLDDVFLSLTGPPPGGPDREPSRPDPPGP